MVILTAVLFTLLHIPEFTVLKNQVEVVNNGGS